MTYRATSLVALSLTLIAPVACKKKDEAATEAPAAEAPPPEPKEPDVPQEPDPPQLAEGRLLYLKGEYAQVVQLLDPIYQDLKARSQYRAGGLAGSWLALAHNRDVNENAEEPATHAQAMGDRTGDPEVVTAGKLAMGAFLLGAEDFDAASASFEAAVAAAPDPSWKSLAKLLHAEAMLGRAYGAGGGNRLENPADLETAGKDYQEAADLAAGTPEADILAGRAHEGLAAVSKYRGDTKGVCTHAAEAKTRYEAAGAGEYLREGPEFLARDARCESAG